LHYHRYNKGAG